MIRKIILGAMLTLFAMSALADSGLYLTSHNESNQITVKCGATVDSEKDTGMPIPATGTRNTAFWLIKSVLGSPIVCDFYEDGSNIDIGRADLTTTAFPWPGTGIVTDYKILAPTQFNVFVDTYPSTTPASAIHVVLTKL